jgi:hypothetical protein
VAKATEETTKVVTANVTEVVTAKVTETVTATVSKDVAQKVRQEVQAETFKEQQKKASSTGIIERMKVVLKPGTEIQYTTLDAEIAPPFHGWEKGTILTLTNGQRWVCTDDERYWCDTTRKPVHVRIVPGIMGGFFMEIERGGRPRVRFLDNNGPAQPPVQAPASN